MKHVIDQVDYTDDGSRIVCDCGDLLVAATPEAVAELFQQHRVDVGLKRGAPSARPDGTRFDFRITRSEALR